MAEDTKNSTENSAENSIAVDLSALGDGNVDAISEDEYVRIHHEAFNAASYMLEEAGKVNPFIILGRRGTDGYAFIDLSGMMSSEKRDACGIIVTGILQKPPAQISEALGGEPEIATFVTEAWVIERDSMDAADKPPSECEDRVECVIFSVYTKEAQGMAQSPIKRDENNNPSIERAKLTFDFQSIGGRFSPASPPKH